MTYQHDFAGRRTSRTEAGQTTKYAYDAAGNLASVTLPDASTVTYTLDGFGRRVSRTKNGVEQRYLYGEGNRLVAVLDAMGAVTEQFVYGTRRHVPDLMLKGGVVYRLLTDQLGSVRLVVNAATGAVAERIDYDAWGVVTGDTAPGFQVLGFAGGLYDADAKLVHFGAREYDAEVGRWVTKDPILFASGDTNIYAYVGNDPVDSVDPWGLYTGVDDAVFAAGGAVVGVVGQGLSDALTGQLSGWQDYAGSAIGGAAGGWALLYVGPVGAGAVGGAATNLAKQGLNNATGKQCQFSASSVAIDTAVGAATGLIPGLRVSGVTAGRGSFNSLFGQMTTKLRNGTIQNVSMRTAGKMLVGRAVETSMIPGAGAAAVAGLGLGQLHWP